MSRTVALVASTTTEDSAETLALRLRYLLERGWDAWLFCKGARWRDEPALRDPRQRGRIELAPDAKADSSPFDGRLRSLRPDLVHFQSGHAAWKGLRKGQLRGSKIAISFRSDDHNLASQDLDLALLWERADALFFPSRGVLERALDRGCPRERAAILEPPVEIPDSEHRLERRDGPLRVLSAGPLEWEQGFEHSIHAVRLLLDMGTECEYRIVGGGDHVQAVAFARHQLGLAEHVHLLSPDGNGKLSEELRSADVFVDPAVTDTTSPTWLAAAQTLGMPFVATVRSAALSEEAGIIVPRRDPRAIATALARLGGDPALRDRMGRAGRLSARMLEIPDPLSELERRYRAILAGEAR